MRILTVLSGILLVIGGGFCFAYTTTAFTGLAFVLGSIMFISGILIAISYIVSGKVFKLPETVFVEGLATALFGFAVLNNQVAETMVIMFFGTWAALAGATRISQAFSVSRFNPSDWAKVIPLAVVNTVAGVIMMQNLITTLSSITLVAAVFVFNGLSQLVYAMYMKPHALTEREREAIKRAEAKEAAAKAKRAQRDELRKLSMTEKKTAKEAIRAQREAELKAKKEAELAKRAKKEKADEKLSGTVQLTPSEAEAIKKAAPAEQLEEDVKIASRIKAVPLTEEAEEAGPEEEKEEVITAAADTETENVSEADEPAAETEEPAEAAGTEETAPTEEEADEPSEGEKTAENSEESTEKDEELTDIDKIVEMRDYAAETLHRPTWHRPINIPSIREKVAAVNQANEEPAEEKEEPVKLKLTAVNLEEIESGIGKVEFEPIQLPKLDFPPERAETVDRKALLEELSKEVEAEETNVEYTPLKLEDLIPERPISSINIDEKKALEERLTTTFHWNL